MGTHGSTNAQAYNDKVDRHETDDRATHKSTRASHMQVGASDSSAGCK